MCHSTLSLQPPPQHYYASIPLPPSALRLFACTPLHTTMPENWGGFMPPYPSTLYQRWTICSSFRNPPLIYPSCPHFIHHCTNAFMPLHWCMLQPKPPLQWLALLKRHRHIFYCSIYLNRYAIIHINRGNLSWKLLRQFCSHINQSIHCVSGWDCRWLESVVFNFLLMVHCVWARLQWTGTREHIAKILERALLNDFCKGSI